MTISTEELMAKQRELLASPASQAPDLQERIARWRERTIQHVLKEGKPPEEMVFVGEQFCPCTPESQCWFHELLAILRDIHARTLK